MRSIAVVALLLLLSGCNSVVPDGDGRYTSYATATSDSDNPMQRAQDQAVAFCEVLGKPMVVESTAGSTRPSPAAWSVHFRCGYPPPVRPYIAPISVPEPPHISVPAAATQPGPSMPQTVAVTRRRYAVVVSFESHA
jgi:hypothetical protein